MTFEALDRGGVDFVTKSGCEVSSEMQRVKGELVQKVRSAASVDFSSMTRLSGGRGGGRTPRTETQPPTQTVRNVPVPTGSTVIVGTSTGT